MWKWLFLICGAIPQKIWWLYGLHQQETFVLFPSKRFLYCLFERQSDTEKNTPSIDAFLSWPWWPGLGQAKSRSPEPYLGLAHMGGRDPSTWAVSHWLPRPLSRELDPKQSSQNRNPCSHLGCRHPKQRLNPLCLNTGPQEPSVLMCVTVALDNQEMQWIPGAVTCDCFFQFYK